jgi:hypothetical protein
VELSAQPLLALHSCIEANNFLFESIQESLVTALQDCASLRTGTSNISEGPQIQSACPEILRGSKDGAAYTGPSFLLDDKAHDGIEDAAKLGTLEHNVEESMQWPLQLPATLKRAQEQVVGKSEQAAPPGTGLIADNVSGNTDVCMQQEKLPGSVKVQSAAMPKHGVIEELEDGNVLCGVSATEGSRLQHVDGDTSLQHPPCQKLPSEPSMACVHGREPAIQEDEISLAPQHCASLADGCSQRLASDSRTCERTAADSSRVSDSGCSVEHETILLPTPEDSQDKSTAVGAVSRADLGCASISSGAGDPLERPHLKMQEGLEESEFKSSSNANRAQDIGGSVTNSSNGEKDQGEDESAWLQAQALRARQAAEWQQRWDADLQQRTELERCVGLQAVHIRLAVVW